MPITNDRVNFEHSEFYAMFYFVMEHFALNNQKIADFRNFLPTTESGMKNRCQCGNAIELFSEQSANNQNDGNREGEAMM